MRIGIDTTLLVQASVREHPGHAEAVAEVGKRLASGDVFALAPQVMAEFIHVITDGRRFEHPLTVAEAVDRAQGWWDAAETERVAPSPESVAQFWRWVREFRLGRKRLLDTMLAATYFSHQVTTILSSNARDFSVFGCFHVIMPGSGARPE